MIELERARAACAYALGCAMVLCAVACGGDGKEESAPLGGGPRRLDVLERTAPPHALAAPRSFFRLELRKQADGSVAVLRSERVTLSALPVPPLTPQFLLEGRAGERIVLAVPVAFIDTVRESWRGADGAPFHKLRKLSVVTTSAFIEAEPSVDSLALTAPGGQVVLQLMVRDIPAALPVPKERGAAEQALSNEELARRFPQIRFLLT